MRSGALKSVDAGLNECAFYCVITPWCVFSDVVRVRLEVMVH